MWHLGNDPSLVREIASGNHPFAKKLKAAKKPLIIVGANQLARKDGSAFVTSLSTPSSLLMYHHNHLGSTKTDEQLKAKSVPLCSVNDVQLRFLCPDDLEEVRTLCQDWFPIDYPLSWYEDITSSTRFFALAAVYNFTIIGLIVAEIKPYTKLNKEDRGILSESMGRDADIGYILSLGVHRKYRQNGIGSLLLDSLINHLTTAERHKVKAIFLHVLTTNQTAILFYERRGFVLHSFLPYYYSIRGKCKDGFTYVSYLNGGHSPWTLYDHLKNWCSLVITAGGLCSWLSGRIRTAFRWVCYRTISRFAFTQDN